MSSSEEWADLVARIRVAVSGGPIVRITAIPDYWPDDTVGMVGKLLTVDFEDPGAPFEVLSDARGTPDAELLWAYAVEPHQVDDDDQ